MMKDLYQPVFWCGFALSLSALYYSSEQVAKEASTPVRKPVLMRISFDESKERDVHLGAPESHPAPSIEEQLPPVPIEEKPVGVSIDLGASEDPFLSQRPSTEPPLTPVETAPAPEPTSSFLSAARKALAAP